MENNKFNFFTVENNGFTVVLIEDSEDGGYTGYYKEKVGVVAEGETVKETLENLSKAYTFFLTFEEEDNLL